MKPTGWLLTLWLLTCGCLWAAPPEEFPEEFPNPPTPSTSSPPVQSASTDRIQAGQSLGTGSQLNSPNRLYQLVLQDDGNCVLYRLSSAPQPLWDTRSRGQGCRLSLNSEGQLQLSDSSGKALWQAGSSHGAGDYYLQLQDDGNLVLYRRQGQVVTPDWASQTSQK